MQLQLPYYDYDLKVPESDKVAIDKLVTASLSEFKGQKAELEELTLACVSNISNSSSISSELVEQGPIKRFFGNVTGKNRKLRDTLYRNTANIQYAQQQILVKLIEQNATVMDFVAAIHKENHTITLNIKQSQLATNTRLRQMCLHLIEHREAIIQLNEANERLSGELDHALFVCPNCRAYVARTARICHQCGYILKSNESSLSTSEGASRFFADLTSLSATIKEIQAMKNVVSASKLDWYQRKIRQIRRYVDKADLPADIRKNVLSKCTRFEHNLEKQHIEVAIAGTVKAGKSSLINALLDTEFASVDSTPETSVLAKYRTTSDESYIRVRFYTEQMWQKVWSEAQRSSIYIDEYRALNADVERSKWIGQSDYYKYGLDIPELQAELSKFTSSKSPIHFFAREVEVGIHSDLFPNDVYLVDTPGLDDVVETRSNITKEYLDKADAVLACIKEKDIHEASETKFISRVMANRSDWKTLFVIATQKDLDKPSDYRKNRDYFVNKVLDPLFNPNIDDSLFTNRKYRPEQQFFGISSQLYSYSLSFEQGDLQDENLRKYITMLSDAGFVDIFNLDISAIFDRLDEIKKDSGIPRLKYWLEKRLFKSTRRILYARMNDAFQDFLKQIHDIVEDGTDVCKDRLDLLASQENELNSKKKEIDDVEALIAKIERYMEDVKSGIGGIK